MSGTLLQGTQHQEGQLLYWISEGEILFFSCSMMVDGSWTVGAEGIPFASFVKLHNSYLPTQTPCESFVYANDVF